MSGIVVDPAGGPVSGAKVEIKEDAGDPAFAEGRSDEAGKFLLADLEPADSRLVVVKTEDFPTWSSLCTITAGETTEVQAQLTRGAKVIGIILDETGAPATDVMVYTSTAPDAEPDEILDTFGLEAPETMTASDGSYSLNAYPGKVTVVAFSFLGTAETVLELQPGEVRCWDATLPGGKYQIRGVVLDEVGAPVANAFVEAGFEFGSANYVEGGLVGTATDNEGRFVIRGLGELPCRVKVWGQCYGLREENSAPLAVVPSVRPGPAEIVLRIQRPTSSMKGVLLDSQGKALASVAVRAYPLPVVADGWLPDSGWKAETDALGAFTLGPLPAGSYQLTATNLGESADTQLLGVYNILPQHDLDLGTVHLAAPGRLVPVVRDGWTLQVSFLSRAGLHLARYWSEGDDAVLSLPPGNYALNASKDLADGESRSWPVVTCQRIVIPSDVDLSVVVPAPALVWRTLQFKLPAGLENDPIWRIVAASGCELIENTLDHKLNPNLRLELGLEPGRYQVIAFTRSLSATAEASVHFDTTSDETVVIELTER
ncbi:MAG: carboxypeptidase-like regulatory domain-containing protein [Planctomycetota bacterium]